MTADEKRATENKTARRGAARLGANAEIGRKLKQYYETLVSEEVPDRFSQLLSKLEQVETYYDLQAVEQFEPGEFFPER